MTDVELVDALTALQQVLAEHCRRLTAGEPVVWDGLGALLDGGARHCYARAGQDLSTWAPAGR